MLPIVSETLDRVLEGYPEYPYRKAFKNPDLRRTLIVHVLSQLPGLYTIDEEGHKLSIRPEDLPLSQEQQLQLTNIIRQEVAYIIQQSSECIRQTKAQEIDACFTPSHWFG